MGWLLDLLDGLNLAPERLAQFNDFESQFDILQRENVQLKLETDNLKEQIAEKEREKQELQRENQDLRKTREFSHDDLSEQYTEPEQVENDIEGIVSDSETT